MTLLGKQAIGAALEAGEIVCDPAPRAIEGCHIDVHLGEWYCLPVAGEGYGVVRPAEDNPAGWYRLVKARDHIVIPAHTHALAHTVEFIGTTVAHLQPFLQTRSTLARWGIPIHLSAGHGDPYYHSRWTLELFNPWAYPVELPVGARVGCIGFLRVEGNDALYTKRYNVPRETWRAEDMLPKVHNL